MYRSNILVTHSWASDICHTFWSLSSYTHIGHIHQPYTVEPQTLTTLIGHIYRPHTVGSHTLVTFIGHTHWPHSFFGPGSDHIHQPHHHKILLPPSSHTTHRPHSSRTCLSSEFHTVWVLSSKFHTLLHTVWVLSSIHSESQTFSAPYIPSSRLSESWVPSSRLSNFRVRCSLHSKLWVPYIPNARIRANFNIGFTHSWITFVPYRHWPHVCFTLQHNTAH